MLCSRLSAADINDKKAGCRHKHRGWKMAASDPFHVTEDEDEQSPEEHSDDSCPDQDNYLHIGLVAWTFSKGGKN